MEAEGSNPSRTTSMVKLLDLSRLSPKKLHGLGSDAREKDNHLEALQYLDHAIVGYQNQSNYEGLIDALKDRTLTWKYYFLLTKDKVYAILAKKDAESMLEIAQEKGLKDKLSTSYFRLGEVAMLFADYSKAERYYKKSLDTYIGPLSERGDFRYHLGEALYRKGDKERGIRTIVKGLEEIKKGSAEVPDFLTHVWKSGCYMRLAKLLKNDDPARARDYFEKVKKIVELDKRLIIRRRQIRELEKSLA